MQGQEPIAVTQVRKGFQGDGSARRKGEFKGDGEEAVACLHSRGGLAFPWNVLWNSTSTTGCSPSRTSLSDLPKVTQALLTLCNILYNVSM